MNELKTIKEALREMEDFMNSGKSTHIQTPQEFGKTIVEVLKSLSYQVEVLQRTIGDSPAFIDPNDSPHRLR